MMGSDRDVGSVITRLRGETTQQALAEAMRERGWRWSQATVWSVEKGERPLKLREAAVLASILDTTLETLLEGDSGLLFLSGQLKATHERIRALEEELATAKTAVTEIENRLQLARQEHEAIYHVLSLSKDEDLKSEMSVLLAAYYADQRREWVSGEDAVSQDVDYEA